VTPSDELTISVNGQKIAWEEDMTVRRVLEVMNYTFRMLVVKVDDKIVKKDQYSSFPIPAGADVKVIHMVAGG
jgi:thiamine biosynthesis protein ThiS